MYTATFTSAKQRFDDAFHALDNVIARAAKGLPDYAGEEAWENTANGLVSTIFYFDTLDALKALTEHPAHLEAKAMQERSLDGYQIVIAEVIRPYGNGKIQHPISSQRTPDNRAAS